MNLRPANRERPLLPLSSSLSSLCLLLHIPPPSSTHQVHLIDAVVVLKAVLGRKPQGDTLAHLTPHIPAGGAEGRAVERGVRETGEGVKGAGKGTKEATHGSSFFRLLMARFLPKSSE